MQGRRKRDARKEVRKIAASLGFSMAVSIVDSVADACMATRCNYRGNRGIYRDSICFHRDTRGDLKD